MYPNFQRGARARQGARSYSGISLVGASSQVALNSSLSRGCGRPEKVSFPARYQKKQHIFLPPAASRITGSIERHEDMFQFPEEAVPTSSGYLPVSSKSKSRLFYLFYETTISPTRIADTPILLWLNGGPGCSSLIGCFYELGPWRLTEKGKLEANNGAWNRRCGLLCVDNPVGAGFSIAATTEDIPKDEYTMAGHLYYALQNFFTQNPTFQKRPFFLAGESYAGKYIPALAYYIMAESSMAPPFPKLAGIAIGNGLTDPRIQVAQHADVSLYLGLIDKEQSLQVRQMANDVIDLIDKAQWMEAHVKRTDLCRWISHVSGIPTLLDIRRTAKYHHREDGTEYLALFLNVTTVRAALKVEKGSPLWVSCRNIIRDIMAPASYVFKVNSSGQVFSIVATHDVIYLKTDKKKWHEFSSVAPGTHQVKKIIRPDTVFMHVKDTMKSTKWMVEAILKAGLPVLLYQGVYDAKDGPASSEAWMRAIAWDHIANFWKAEREVWKVKGKLAGYWRSWKNLTHVVVQGAGHQVPVDQPVFSQDMIERWMQEALQASKKVNEIPGQKQDQRSCIADERRQGTE